MLKPKSAAQVPRVACIIITLSKNVRGLEGGEFGVDLVNLGEEGVLAGLEGVLAGGGLVDNGQAVGLGDRTEQATDLENCVVVTDAGVGA